MERELMVDLSDGPINSASSLPHTLALGFPSNPPSLTKNEYLRVESKSMSPPGLFIRLGQICPPNMFFAFVKTRSFSGSVVKSAARMESGMDSTVRNGGTYG